MKGPTAPCCQNTANKMVPSRHKWWNHYRDVIMGTMASQITSITIVYSTVYSGADQRKRQSSASLAFVREIHRLPVNFPHKWPVTRKMSPFDDVIMQSRTARKSLKNSTISFGTYVQIKRHHWKRTLQNSLVILEQQYINFVSVYPYGENIEQIMKSLRN